MESSSDPLAEEAVPFDKMYVSVCLGQGTPPENAKCRRCREDDDGA